MLIRIRKAWDRVPENEATPESVYFSRRELLRAAVAAGTGALILGPSGILRAEDAKSPYPSKRNEKYKLDRPISAEAQATGFNNFYEFTTNKGAVKDTVSLFNPEPWKVEVGGLCAKPRTFDLDDLRKFDHEERLYRHRCVETWAMAVPWTGFPIAKLLEKVEPKAEAKFLRFVSFNRPEECPGMKEEAKYPWPYFEGLTMEEAKNELALFVTGIYGKKLPKQNGAPIRVVTPWKYGYKSAKSIVKIELVAAKPETFWHKAYPEEYGFFSNVNPKVPHPRWSQAAERMIGTGVRHDTLPYNGYEDLVAGLYKDMKLEKPGD
jgi:sulfoxide reductase catalytic subunit YedY